MPARGYSVTPRKKRPEPKRKPKVRVAQPPGERAATNVAKRAAADATREAVKRERTKVRAGKGLKADTGDVTKNTAAPTLKERRRALGAQYPSGRQSALSQVLTGQSEATKRRDEALQAFDRAARREGLRTTGERPSPERAAKETAEGFGKIRARRAKKQAEVVAPAVSALNETLRPIRAVAGATEQVVKGHPERAPSAAARGLVKNKGPTFGKILRDAGAPKGVSAVGGFLLDVGLDPINWATLGASIPARKAAEAAARKATSEALAKGLSKKAANRAGRAAATKTLADPKLQNKGLTIGVRAKVPFTKKPQIDVRTSGKTTAAISRKTGASKAATKIRSTGPVQALGKGLVPDFRPAGVTPREHAALRAAQRESRAAVGSARRQADRELKALRSAIPDQKTAERIIDHIESGRPLRELGELADTARAIRRMVGEEFDAKKARGLINMPYAPGRVKVEPTPATRPPQSGVRAAKRERARASRAVESAQRKAAREEGRTRLLVEQQRRRDLGTAKMLEQQAKGLDDQATKLVAASRKNMVGERRLDITKTKVGPETKAQRRYRQKATRTGVRKQGIQVGSQRYRTGQRQARRAEEMKARAANLRKEAEEIRARKTGDITQPTRALARLERVQANVTVAKQARARARVAVKTAKAEAKGTPRQPGGGYRIDPLQAAVEPKRYLPRVRRVDLEPGRDGTLARKTGRTKVAPERTRTMRDEMAVLRKTHPDVFSEDLPAVIAHSRLKTREKAAVADFWQKVAKGGRPLPVAAKDMDLTEEMIFRVKPDGLEPLVKAGGDKAPDPKAIGKALEGGDGETYVVLNRDNYERLLRSQGDSRNELGRGFDKFQGTWKTIVTVPMPGYHVRNFVGDSLNAYKADTTAYSYGQSLKVMKSRIVRNRDEARKLAMRDTSPKLTIGGRTRTHRQWLAEAEARGVIDQGFIGKELPYERGSTKLGPLTKAANAAQYREDVPRLATYFSALERGLKPREAAEWANKHHFDYGDLTDVERGLLRRAIPFYTFFARNTRLQATKILTRPGKHATIAKAMEEAAVAAGFKDYEDYVEHLPDHQKQGLPIPLKFGKEVTSWIYMPPATDLRALTLNLESHAQNIAQRITAAKLIYELRSNHSEFFQGPIERKGQKLVPAPSILGKLPSPIREKIGVAQYRDKRRGVIWGWPAKLDYVARSLPETNFLIQQLTPVPGSRQQSPGQSRIGTLTGFKPTTYSTTVEDERIRDEAKKLSELTDERNNLMRTPEAVGPDGYASPRLAKLRAQIKRQDALLKKLKTARGDDTAERRIELAPADELQQRFEEFVNDPEAQGRKMQERFDKFLREGGG